MKFVQCFCNFKLKRSKEILELFRHFVSFEPDHLNTFWTVNHHLKQETLIGSIDFMLKKIGFFKIIGFLLYVCVSGSKTC